MKTVSETLREAILASGVPASTVSRAAGISPPMTTRFLVGDRGLSSRSIDKLCLALNLTLVPTGEPVTLSDKAEEKA